MRLFAWNAPAFLRSCLEDGEVSLEVLVQLEDGGHVAASVAIIWRGPDCENSLVEVPLVSLHHELVRSAYHLDVVGLVELGHNV